MAGRCGSSPHERNLVCECGPDGVMGWGHGGSMSPTVLCPSAARGNGNPKPRKEKRPVFWKARRRRTEDRGQRTEGRVKIQAKQNEGPRQKSDLVRSRNYEINDMHLTTVFKSPFFSVLCPLSSEFRFCRFSYPPQIPRSMWNRLGLRR